MSWSWNNPSASEAEEAYSYYKKKYNNAASKKRASEQQEQNYIAEKKAYDCVAWFCFDKL